jgi:class 3 adenylate cyclase/pimeloyl-ACP methyl ester carboxylesterase
MRRPLHPAAGGACVHRRCCTIAVVDTEIRYVRAADGTRIAVRLFGDRSLPPLLYVVAWATTSPMTGEGSVMAALTRERYVIAHDRRGTGASSREVTDLGLDAQVADLVAVTEAVAAGAADVVAWFDGAPIAIAYAARYPERVRKLALWHPFIDGSHYLPPERVQALTALAQTDWTLALHTLAKIWSPRGSAEDLRTLVRAFRERLSPDVFARSLEAVQATNVEEEAPRVRAETLVLFPRDAGFSPRHAQDAASLIPRASLQQLDQTAGFAKGPLGVSTILGFLRGAEDAPPAPHSTLPSGMTAIFFADIADSTALTERMGDGAFRERARALDVELRRAIAAGGGTTIDAKTLGDGVLATFASAAQAIEAALACGAAGDVAGLPLHLGLHAGDVIREDSNVFGGAVNIAARISGLAAPGELLVSDVVRALARTSAGVTFSDRGEHALRGVAERQRLYAVRKESEA